MAHARTAVLEAVKTLIGGNGVTVERTRVYPEDEGRLPRYLVYATGEVIDWDRSSSDGIMRELTTVVEVLISDAVADVEDALFTHTQYIEDLMLYGTQIGGSIATMLLNSTYTYGGEGQTGLGIAALTFRIDYRTLPDNASALT